jgi:competence protein ComEC
MVLFSLAFLSGILLFQQLPALPPVWLVPVLVCATTLILGTRLRWPAAALIGFGWVWLHAAVALEHRWPEAASGEVVMLTGVVQGLPEANGPAQRFVLDVESVGPLSGPRQGQGGHDPWRGRARLSWRDGEPVRAGQRWRLRAKLFTPNGFRNPGGFDYERWLYASGIGATGYVLAGSANGLIGDGSASALHHRVRQWIRDRVDAAGANPDAAALFRALVIGDRSGFDTGHWSVFRATGTSHLVAISGLHLGLVAGLAFWLTDRAWRLSARLCNRLPARIAAAIGALAVAVLYALLAGLSLPTQRALAMLAAGFGALLLRRVTTPAVLLANALVAVLVVDPDAVLAGGFWLSFAAVAIILLVVAGSHRPEATRAWGRVQVSLGIALVPVLAAWDLPVAVGAPVVNLVAVPWFTLVVVPVALLTVVALAFGEPAGGFALEISLWLLGHTFVALEAVANLTGWVWKPGARGIGVILLAAIGCICLLLPLTVKLRALGLAMLLPLVLPRGAALPAGALEIAMLDVGQGLSVVVRTARHALVYDLGARFSPAFSAAEAVTLPFLASRGVREVDVLMLSHDDADHVGAWPAFVDRIPVRRLLAGQPERLTPTAQPCRRGASWTWDEVQFELLHPAAAIAGGEHDNDRSCVLRIVHPAASFLVTGDITRRVEARLAREDRVALHADFVVIPHHGSRSSSSRALTGASRAGFALVSAGYRNRYGFPATEVVRRWRAAGAAVIDTAQAGAVIISVPPQGEGEPAITRYREAARRYWHR